MLQELSKDLFESYLHAELSCSFQNGRNVLFCPDDKSISIQTFYGRQWRMQSNNRVTSILGYNDDCRLSFASSVHHLSRCFKSLKQEIMWQSNILICDNQFFLSDFWRKKQWLGFCFDSDPKSRVVSCVCNLTKSSTDGKFNIQQIAKSHFLFLFTDWITEIGDRIINGCHWDGNYSLQNLDLFSPRHSVPFLAFAVYSRSKVSMQTWAQKGNVRVIDINIANSDTCPSGARRFRKDIIQLYLHQLPKYFLILFPINIFCNQTKL